MAKGAGGMSHQIAPINVLSAVTTWPLLAAFLLFVTPDSRQKASGLTFAVAGALLTPLAVVLMPGTDAFAAACSCAVALMPLLLPPGADRASRILPFLITGCALIALNVHSALAVTVLCGAGIVLLAWREGRGTQKASSVWDMARSRLCGVVLGALGAALLPMQHQSPLGPVLLAIGLCMMAGLGPSPAPRSAAALMDTCLRFAAIVLMMRLNTQPLVHVLVLVAGFASLLMAVTASGARVALPMLSALAAISAATGEAAAVLLLLIAALGTTTLETRGKSTETDAIFWGSAPWPVFCALILIGRSLEIALLWLLVGCVALGLRGASLPLILPAWQRGERNMVAFVEVALLLCGLTAPLLLVWHPVAGWRP